MAATPSIERRVERERVSHFMRAVSGPFVSIIGIAMGAMFLSWKQVPTVAVLTWLVTLSVLLHLRSRIADQYRLDPGRPSKPLVNRVIAVTALLGLGWGSSIVLMHISAGEIIRGDYAIMTFIIVAAVMYSLLQLSASPMASTAFALLAVIPTMLVLANLGTGRARVGVILLAGFLAFALIASRMLRETLQRNLLLQIQNEDLSYSLRDARGSAEELGSKLRSASYYDSVTGLPNRNYFLERVDHAISGPELNDIRHAVMHIDLNNFRRINESMGREVGDELLRNAGSRLRETLRTSDVLSHMGADEFMVLLENVSSATQASRIAEKLGEAMSDPIELGGEPISVTCNIGISLYPEDGRNTRDLLEQAETAMLHAKRNHGAAVAFFTAEMQRRVRERLEIEQRLSAALDSSELDVHYQPQHHVENRRIVGLEALLRWTHPQHGNISPAVFVAVAEEAGMVPRLDRYVVERVFEQAAAWNHEGIRPPRISINLSAITLNQPSLRNDLTELLEKHNARADWFDLELTETVFLGRDDRLGARLQEFRGMGFRLSLDDFGTGYSSLGYLRRFPMDILKIDRSFIMDVTDDPSDAAIVKAIIAMARHLNLDLIAEGVESEEQLTFLREAGCEQAQGFLFSGAQPADQLATVLR